jgi:hypothetical protein
VRSLASEDQLLTGSLALVVLVSLVAVFFRLGARGLWGDEVWQVSWSQQQGWLETFQRFRAPPDLPLSILLTKASVAFGEDPFFARLPSAVLGAATTIVTFFLARRVFGLPTAAVAALLLALAPFHVWYAQDARPYAALSFYAVASLALFWRLLERPTAITTLAYAATIILGLYNHMFGALPIVVEMFYFVAWALHAWFRSPPDLRRERRHRAGRAGAGLAFAGVAAADATVPLHDGVLSYVRSGSPGAVDNPPFVPTIELIEGLFGSFGAGTGPLFWVVLALFTLGTVTALRRGIAFAALALGWLVLPIAALWIAQPQHIFIPRYVLYLQPVYLIVVGYGLVVVASALHRAIGRRSRTAARASVAMVAAPILLAFAIPTASTYGAPRGTDWTAMCRYLEASVSAGDVVVGNGYHEGIMGWCLRGTPEAAVAPAGSYDIGDLAASGRRAWYVFIPPGPPDPLLEAIGYEVVPSDRWGGIPPSGPISRFQFPVGEHGATLYRHVPAHLPRALSFTEQDGAFISPNWPDYAQRGAGGRYQVRLSLESRAPREIEVDYLDSDGSDIEVYLDGRLARRLVGGTGEGGWTSASIPVPPSRGDVILVELRNPGSELIAFSGVELRYRAAD